MITRMITPLNIANTIVDNFIWYALAAGFGVVLMTAPLGVFVSWRKMAYFGDTLAHSGLLGLSLGLVANININFAIVLVAISVALLLLLLQHNRQIATDSLLGILAHSNLAFGMLAISLTDTGRIDLMAYLFGDILTVSPSDLLLIWLGVILVAMIMFKLWHALLAITIHEELAQVEGISVKKSNLIFTLTIAIVIAISMKIIGVLLVTALMIIPAATARHFSRTPEQMLFYTIIFGFISIIAGISMSWYVDTMTGPSIVAANATLFFISQILFYLRSQKH